MLQSTWPRLQSAVTCCCSRGSRLYSSRGGGGSNRTLPDRPSFASAPRGWTRTYDRRDKQRSRPPQPNSKAQQRYQAERNLRRKLVEGRLSLAELTEAAAAIEGLDPKEITAGGGLKSSDTGTADTHGESIANTEREGERSEWSLLKRRQRGTETGFAPENTQDVGESETLTANAEKWPLLKRREPSYGYMELTDMPADDDSTDVVTTPSNDSTDLVAETHAALANKDDAPVAKSHTMIRIDGLSTNVLASDFYRIAETDLSKWNQSIRKVQQVRDRMTLEPTGTYNVTFSTAVAATAYAARFQRLHALSRVRARSRTGLWRSEVPPALLLPPPSSSPASSTQDDLEAELSRLSVAAGVHPAALAHRRVAAGPESNKIRGLVAGDALGEQPPVVLVDVSPAAPAERVRAAVRAHGQRARGSWGLAHAHPIGANLAQQIQRLGDQVAAYNEKQQRNEAAEEPVWEIRSVLCKREGLRRVARHMEGAALRRFVVAFRDQADAQRFHRLWNGRWLGGKDVPPGNGAPRHFVRTQVLDY